jgi:eukaryotic-like serine/threonine-protein kinase
MDPDDPTLTQLPSGTQPVPALAGKYRIIGRIGQGGMGVVYRAIDDDLDRTVALKFIPAELGGDSNTVQRFLREARAASALDHVNIGTIFGVEETEDHRRFIVMAFYEGLNLSERMKDEVQPLSPGEAVSIAIQVARGLAEAHARGVIHRDIKPSNILITTQCVVKIVDFGLASMSDADHLTLTGVSMGTPAYMSPEQAQGQSVDHRSDIWSLGVVLLEMLTRQRAFHADTVPGVLYQIVHGRVPALEHLQQPFRGILTHALQKDPSKRYQSANDFLAAMEAVPPGMIPAGSFAPQSHVRRLFGRHRLAFASLILLSGIVATTAYLWKTGKFGSGGPSIAGRSASTSVYDKYLQGVELMKRWDKEGNLDRATALLEDATKSDPGFALGFARLAEAQRLRYALTRDKTILDAATRNAERAMQLNPELAPVQVVWGRVQALRGNSDLAMASFERAIRIDPNEADAQLAIARQYERLGRLADAEAAFQKAGSLDPDGIAAHDFYANFLFRQGRQADAIREWQTVVRIAPDNAAAYVNLGASLSETGRVDEAIAAYQRALTLKPTDMGYSNLGTAYSHTGRYPEAVSAYLKALELTKNNYMIWGNLAESYSQIKGRESEAEQAFAQAIALAEQGRKDSPRDPFVHRSLGEYYARTGNAPLARQRMETALTLAPTTPEIQAAASEMYALLGQNAKALTFAKRALELGYPRRRLQDNSELVKLMPELK